MIFPSSYTQKSELDTVSGPSQTWEMGTVRSSMWRRKNILPQSVSTVFGNTALLIAPHSRCSRPVALLMKKRIIHHGESRFWASTLGCTPFLLHLCLSLKHLLYFINRIYVWRETVRSNVERLSLALKDDTVCLSLLMTENFHAKLSLVPRSS